MQIAILGRQPKISIAELEALFGAQNITLVSDYAALIDTDSPLSQLRLGGTMKSAVLLNRLENIELQGAFAYLETFLPEHFMYLPKGKLQFGVSVYGFKAQRDWLLKRMLTLKKIIKKTGQSVRIIENKAEALESAQVLYNKLTSELGCEILLIKDGADVLVAQTTAVQNIDDYSKRDFGRPMRDAYVGMLPPKLAQIMINLGSGGQKIENGQTAKLSANTILDPFCGTGVVLQEALLMGYGAYGTDLSEKMVDYSTENIEWLKKEYELKNTNFKVEQADATTHQWDLPNHQQPSPTPQIVCETYLGTPLSALPERKKLQEISDVANKIAEEFLKNIAGQIEKGTRLTVALPAWYLGNGRFLHLPVLDHLQDLGYNRLEFAHVTKSELIYHRTDQIVARELTILEKN